MKRSEAPPSNGEGKNPHPIFKGTYGWDKGWGRGGGRGKRREGDDNLLLPVMSVENHEGLIDDLEGSPNGQYDAPPTEIPQPTYKRLF